MNKKYKKPLQFIFFFALTFLLLWFSFKDIAWAGLWAGICTAHYGWVAISVLIGIVAYFLRALRWQLLIHPLGYSPSLKSVYRGVIIGYLANFIFPRFGEIARCGTLTKSDGVPFDKLVGTVVVERVVDLICLIIIVAVTFFLELDTFGKFVRESLLQKIDPSQLITLLLLLVGFLVLVVISVLVLKRKRDNAVVKKIVLFLQGIREGLTAFAQMQHRWRFVLHTLLIWICYWLMGWLVVYAVPAFSHFTAVDGLLVMLLGSLGIVAPTSGGLGAFHVILKLGMPALFGVTESDALLYATLSHESQMLFIIILGLVAYVQVFLRKNKSAVPQ